MDDQELVSRFNAWAPDHTLRYSERVAVAAGAMREKRRELIAQPLQEVWVLLARAGLEAVDKWDLQNEQDGREELGWTPEEIKSAEAAVAAAEKAAIDARTLRDNLYVRRSSELYGISPGMRVRIKDEEYIVEEVEARSWGGKPWLTGRKFKKNGEPGGGLRRLFCDWEIVA